MCPRFPPLVPSLEDLLRRMMTVRTAPEYETEGYDAEFVRSAAAMPALGLHGRVSSLPVLGGCWEKRWYSGSLRMVFRP